MNDIRTAHLEKDNEIDSLTCSVCGASLKHAMIINGTVYGMDCGANFLGWKIQSPAAVDNRIENISKSIRQFRGFMKGSRPVSDWKRNAIARIVCKNLGIADFPNGGVPLWNFVFEIIGRE